MLGEGRPFVLEIQNARRAVPPPAELARLEAAVEQVGGGRGGGWQGCERMPASKRTAEETVP